MTLESSSGPRLRSLGDGLEAAVDITLNIDVLGTSTRIWIEDEARRTGKSVEAVIEHLIQRGVAVERQASLPQLFHDLDSLAGTWSVEEANAFRAATTDFSKIDETLWR
jgi:hypothetical protein